MSGTITTLQLRDIRNEYKEHLRQTLAGRPESTINTIWSDTFFILNNEVGVNFWDCFLSEDAFTQAQEALQKFFAKKDKNSEQRAKGYIANMRRFKEFLDGKHPTLAEDWSKKTMQAEEQMTAPNYSLVTAEHIRTALDYIKQNGTPKNRGSRTRYLVYNGERYAPKWVFAVAYTTALGKDVADAESVMTYTTSQILPTLRKFANEIDYEVILENGEKDLSEMTSQERQLAFKKWMEKVATKQSGGRFEKNTIGAYFTALNTLGKQLKERGLYSSGVFENYEPEKTDEIITIYNESQELQEFFDKRKETSNVGSGLTQYKAFLLYEAEPSSLEGLSAQEVERLFKDWLIEQSKIEGSPAQSTLTGYISQLKRLWADEKGNSVQGKKASPFEHVLADEFDGIANELKDTEVYGDWTLDWYSHFLREYGTDGAATADDEVAKFKQLLAWFVKQVKINNGIIEGTSTSGAGYKGHKIREQYKQWRSYKGFDLDCAIQAGYQKASQNNYIHLTLTWLNIIPKFIKTGDASDVHALQIVMKKEGNLVEREYPEKTIAVLDLFSDAPPNDELKTFFETFKGEIKRYKKEQGDTGESNGGIKMRGENAIFYGVPGSGKSYSIKDRVKAIGKGDYDALEKSGNIVRVVFHPDYTYSDFVGQILPTTDRNGLVRYVFKHGPFTSIMELAYSDERKNEPFILVIEEINRGNAAAIFGDLFQLLDRDKSGTSEYGITSPEIAQSIFGDKMALIKIPNNLWLFATMNTSDQNVFTLDTAFQRRWDMELVRNDFNDKDHSFIIEGTGVTWKAFAMRVNAILAKQDGVMSSEDKSLGAWFIRPDSADEKTVSGKRFANKVLKYLWDDAFKFDRKRFFNTDRYSTLEQVIAGFKALKTENGFGELLKEFASKDESITEAETETV